MTLDDTSRYATREMVQVFGRNNTLAIQRQLWIKILWEQAGTNGVTPEVVKDYVGVHDRLIRGVADPITPPSGDDWLYHQRYKLLIDEAERKIRHDLKAHLQVFDELAGGHGKLHLGLTSSDITENTVQRQQQLAGQLIVDRIDQVLYRLADWVSSHLQTKLVMVGRTHNVPAQPILLASRYAHCASRLLAVPVIPPIRRRGVRGAVGNNSDWDRLLPDHEPNLTLMGDWATTTQIYPRTSDTDLAQWLLSILDPICDLATTLRLMAGNGYTWEGGGEAVGSSAMPHKRPNMRYAERVCGLRPVLLGYQTMLTSTPPSWNEGDVSDSVTRRVAIPGMFYTVDAALRSFHRLLGLHGHNPELIKQELHRYRQELGSGRLLAGLVAERGWSREAAHEALRFAYQKLRELDGLTLEAVLFDDHDVPMSWTAKILDDHQTGYATQEAQDVLQAIKRRFSSTPPTELRLDIDTL